MKIELKLYASLSKYLPTNARRNEAALVVADDATVGSVLGKLGAPRENCHLVLINGAYVAPSERDNHSLKDGDVLAAWPPVAGG
jgi:molybdopterin converting factor small subunit